MSKKYSTKVRTKQAEEFNREWTEKHGGSKGTDATVMNNSLANGNKEKYNKNAITGFVLSIISVLGIGLAGLIGFILGIVALTQIKHTSEKGKGIAIAAIIIGFIWGFVIGILRQLVQAGF